MLDSLPLHDATLREVRFAWAEGLCTLHVQTSGHGAQELVFSGVTELHLPRQQPWGPSVSINAARECGSNKFEVELQSGDVLRLQAASWKVFADVAP
jgi:hypothetical protein